MTGTGDITVGVKTFMRTPKLRVCLDSLAGLAWREVLVADDGPIDAEREAMYAEASRRLPLRLLRLPFDTGLAAGRNEIVRQCTAPYLLMLDDDMIVPPDAGKLTEVLDENPEIGGVSCVLFEHGERKCTACNIRIDGRKVIKEFVGDAELRTTSSGQRYAVFDFVPNAALFRTACLQQLPWDPFYKIGKEHLDFYLAHKRLGRWKFAVSLDVEMGHHPEGSSASYGQFRHGERVRLSERYFLQKFDIAEVVEGRKFDADWTSGHAPPVGPGRPESRPGHRIGAIRHRL